MGREGAAQEKALLKMLKFCTVEKGGQNGSKW